VRPVAPQGAAAARLVCGPDPTILFPSRSACLSLPRATCIYQVWRSLAMTRSAVAPATARFYHPQPT